MNNALNIVTTNPKSDQQYRLRDARPPQWFSQYTTEGAGFGYMSFTLARKTGRNYPDIGHGFPITVRKGPFRVVFDGQITKIAERSGPTSQEIEVWCLGWIHTGSADIYNHIYTDNRLTQWFTSEDPSGSYTPQKFNVESSDGTITIKPRRGTAPGTSTFMTNGDYVRIRYTFPFGEVWRRLTFSFDLALPSSFPAKFVIADSTGVMPFEWSATQSGSFALNTAVDSEWIEFRFIMTQSVDVTAVDGTVYLELSNIVLISENNVEEVTADLVLSDIVTNVLSLDGHGLSDRLDAIETPGFDLVPSAFDTDMSPTEIINWCVQFGDGSGNPWVWGVLFDDRRRVFLRELDRTTVRYIVKADRASLEREGDWSESAQKVYGVYQNVNDTTTRTADVSDSAAIADLGGYYRRVRIDLNGIRSSTLANAMLNLWLAENSRPSGAGTYIVQGGVYTPEGRFVPVEELVPGGLVQVQEWRAIEATLGGSTDYRDNVTTFELAGVKIDAANHTAELIPRQSSDAFARNMAIIAQLQGT